MRRSIRKQFAVIFSGLMILTILLCLLINSVFLERYYISSKTKTILNAYKVISQASKSETYSTMEFVDALDKISTVSNISVCIMDNNSQTIYRNAKDGKELEGMLFRYIFDLEQIPSKEIERTGEYVLLKSKMDKAGEALMLYGRLDSGISVIMRTPLESMHESAAIANRFFLYAGLIGAIIGGLIIWLVSGRISKPIKQLNAISEQMVHLHFDARYTGNEKNEIGTLGSNINDLSASLEKAIAELKTANNELQKDVERKEQIDEMRKEFLANVSHELKTPIALIQGYAEGLADSVNDDEESRNFYCEVITDEAAKMNRLVQKLLTLNQLEFGNETVQLERVDIASIIEGYLQSGAVLAVQNGITLSCDFEGPVYVWGDDFKLEEVFSNYYSNAVHYCEGDKKIIIGLEKIDNHARISVFNTGKQIPEEALPFLWDKFYKVDKARTREYGGSGVGLSIVKAIMDSMGQKYGVENKENGVLFWFEAETCERTL